MGNHIKHDIGTRIMVRSRIHQARLAWSSAEAQAQAQATDTRSKREDHDQGFLGHRVSPYPKPSSMLSLSLLYLQLAARYLPIPDLMPAHRPPILAAHEAVKMHISHGVRFEGL